MRWIFLIRQVGKPYLLLFYLFLLSEGAPYAQRLLLPRLADWLILPALTWTALYFTLIMFAISVLMMAAGLRYLREFRRTLERVAAPAERAAR